jgi:hypothetical protein
MLHDPIGIRGDHATVAFMAGLGAPRPRLLAPFLAIRRGGLRRRARRLDRPLQLQHQFDQFFLAQPFEIDPPHRGIESGCRP